MADNPVFAFIPDLFRPGRVHVEVIQVVHIPYVTIGLGTTAYSYDSRDNLTGASLPGGLAASFAYDNVNRLSSWSVSKAGSNLLARSCTRNGLGFKEVESITAGLETLDGPSSQARTHNAADQITGIAQSVPEAQGIPFFDPAGNTTQVVLSVKGQTFTTLYRYDYENRLLGVTRLRNGTQGESVTTSVVQLEYDGLGLLLRITETGTVRRLVRDRVDQLARPLVETDGSGNAVRWFVWANGRLLAQVGADSVVRVAHCDELGRVLAFSDNNGAMTDEYAYQPYGRLVAHSGTTETPFTWLGSFGVLDIGHGLYLTKHRAYDANLASFTQADPAGLAGGFNLYALASGSPLAWIDVLGLCPDEPRSWFSPAPSRASAYSGPVLTSPQRINEQRQASEFLGAFGTQINSPEIARGVASDLLLAVPTAVVGGMVDDALRGAVNFLRGGARGSTALVKYEPWPRAPNSPHADGFLFGARQAETAQPGQIISRFGETTGRYASPPGTSLSARGLPAGYQGSESLWQVTKPFSMESGLSAPWQGSSGMGIQHKLPQSIEGLWSSGYLTPVR